MVREKGGTLIVVPCWWDGSNESLAASIMFQRPDLKMEVSEHLLIPLNPPPRYYTSIGVPGVGELMLACFPMHSNWGQDLSDESPWWMGEKYDGIRGCWNPVNYQLYSRRGFVLEILDSMKLQMPADFFDSEVWFGRGQITSSNSLVAGSDLVPWHCIRLIGFDIIPTMNGNIDPMLPFEDRYHSMLDIIPYHHPFTIPAYRQKVIREKQVLRAIKHITRHAGEGVILRRPNSIYENGKSSNLLKIKVARGDKEAIVLDISKQSVLLKMPSGVKFEIPNRESTNITTTTTTTTATMKLKRGDVVTFSYDHFSISNIPVNPSIVRVRHDVSWEDVVIQASQEPAVKPREVSAGYWKTGKGKNMRLYFENFARSQQLDPLLNTTWYNTPQSSFSDTETGRLILRYFGGDYVRALRYLFPEINFDDSKFINLSKVHWKDPSKRRKWFEEIAKRKGLDPLLPDTWYQISKKKIILSKVGQDVLHYYSNSFVSAIEHLFPEIKLDPEMFPALIKRHFWRDVKNRRSFFMNFAQKNKFDPLIPANWYKTNSQQLIEKGASGFISYYNGSITSALIDCFPEIKFEETKFTTVPRNYWQLESNRRQLLDNYAKENNFDPLIADNWYSVSSLALNDLGAKSMLSYYNGSISKALVELYPEVCLDLSKFSNVPKNFWQDKNNRKQYFIRFAEENGFDPLVAENWYSSSAAKIIEMRTSGCIGYYNGNFVQALLELFPQIGLEKSKLLGISKYYWKDNDNQRKVFEQYAKENKFDPLVASNWYDKSTRAALKKRSNYFIAHYNGSVSQALIHLFPNINFSKK